MPGNLITVLTQRKRASGDVKRALYSLCGGALVEVIPEDAHLGVPLLALATFLPSGDSRCRATAVAWDSVALSSDVLGISSWRRRRPASGNGSDIWMTWCIASRRRSSRWLRR